MSAAYLYVFVYTMWGVEVERRLVEVEVEVEVCECEGWRQRCALRCTQTERYTHTSTYAQVRATYTASHAAGSDASLLRSMPLISAPKAGVYRLISRPENSSVGILR